MNFLLLSLLVWLWNWRSYDQISARNLALKEAEAAYLAGNYQLASKQYQFLQANSRNIDPLVNLNLGHSLFRLKKYQQAREAYERAIRYVPEQATDAITQLGVIACIEQDSARALSLFQQALLINPNDDGARYNYEIIRQLYTAPSISPEKRKSQPKVKPQPPVKQPNTGADVAKTDEQKEVLHRLRSLNISEEQAMQLLNAMRDDDLPYELARRRQQATNQPKRKDRW